jgi:hypothetical protein
MKKPERLLVPAVLVVSACSPPPTPVCGSSPDDICMPDGGYYCPPDCGTARTEDGGVLFVDGQPECFC